MIKLSISTITYLFHHNFKFFKLDSLVIINVVLIEDLFYFLLSQTSAKLCKSILDVCVCYVTILVHIKTII